MKTSERLDQIEDCLRAASISVAEAMLRLKERGREVDKYNTNEPGYVCFHKHGAFRVFVYESDALEFLETAEGKDFSITEAEIIFNLP